MPIALLALALALLTACGRPVVGGPGGRASPALPPVPKGAPRVAPDPRLAIVNARIAHMTLDEELGQLFVVVYPSAYPDPALMQQLTQAMQAASPIPLIISADEEGGGDDQINQIFGPHPDAWDIGATGDPSVAAQSGARIGGELQQLGINADFAPVVDVEAPSRAWTRSFGRDPNVVAQMAGAYMDTIQGMGLMACLKHFPGLGAADVNPHDALPIITSSHDYIEQYDLAPYRALISHHPAMIMTTDLLMPALDPTMPAELSQPIVTGVLRQELGYTGVVITDALYMGGISQKWTLPQAAVLAIEAGNDMLEGAWGPWEMQTMVDALRAAVQSGQITKARIDDSVRRILMLKLDYHLLPVTQPPEEQKAGDGLAAPPTGAVGLIGVAASSGPALAPEVRRQGLAD